MRRTDSADRRAMESIGLLMIAQLIGTDAQLNTSILNARVLGVDQFGAFALVIAIVGFSVLLLRLGFFSSGEVLLANTGDREQRRRIVGALLVVAAVLGVAVAIILSMLAPRLDAWF